LAQTTSEVWDSRWSSTRRTVRPEVVDNFFESYPTVQKHRRGGMQITDRGGKEISVILQSSGSTAVAFDKYDNVGKDPVDPFETAHYKRRYYAVPIILSDTENWENSGPEQIFDLLNALGDNAMDSLVKAINEDILGAQAGKTILGYQDIIADAGTGTVGGINSGNDTFWQNQKDANAVTFTTATVANIFNGIDKWNDVMDSCRIQGGTNFCIVTTHSIGRAYRECVSSTGYAETRLSSAQGVGGPILPTFYGHEVIADNDCKALASYFVEMNHTKLNVLRQANFRKTQFTSLQPNGQLAQLAYMVAGVQLTTNNRRRSGVATAITGA
jgi:hypothetical protein